MFHNPMLVTEIDILVLLAVACLTAIALKRIKFPYTVALVLLGIGLGWLGQHGLEFLQTLTLSHDLILFVFVPPLIFESALNLDSRLLLRNLTPILTLAAPGLLISTAIGGGIVK